MSQQQNLLMSTSGLTTLTLRKPDDFHLHLRDGDCLKRTVADTAKQFSRAIIMPNLVPPIINTTLAMDYRARILEAIPSAYTFEPLMTLYLTDKTTPSCIQEAASNPHIYACKLYLAGITTNADAGVKRLSAIYPALEAMQKHDMPLLVHGEVDKGSTDIFAREKLFLNTVLDPLLTDFPKLRVVIEHITTAEAVEYVSNHSARLAATITAHHLLIDRNDLLKNGIHPHHYCLPVPQTGTDRQALLKAATSGNPKFFLGTDSAPHAQHRKECAHGCAGIYTAHAAIEFYATAFEHRQALDKLEGFASHYGAAFYGLPVNTDTITLVRQPWTIPGTFSFGEDTVVPFYAGKRLGWKVGEA